MDLVAKGVRHFMTWKSCKLRRCVCLCHFMNIHIGYVIFIEFIILVKFQSVLTGAVT